MGEPETRDGQPSAGDGATTPRRSIASRSIRLVIRLVLTACGLLVVLIGYGGCVLSYQVLVPGWITFGIAAGLGFFVAALGLLRRWNSVLRWMCFLVAYALFLEVITRVDHLPQARLKATYLSIQVGMTTGEVRAVIRINFPDKQPTVRFGKRRGSIAVKPIDPGYDPDRVELTIENGLVTTKRYISDIDITQP